MPKYMLCIHVLRIGKTTHYSVKIINLVLSHSVKQRKVFKQRLSVSANDLMN